MSYLSYEGLLSAIEDEHLDPSYRLLIEPYDRGRLRSASIELFVGTTLARWRHGPHYATLAPKALADISEQDFAIERGLAEGDRFALHPGEAILLAVDCWISVGNGLLCRVDGKSSIGRASQVIHTAGLVEPGFHGVLTLEPINLSPHTIVYQVGQPIAQLTVAQLDRPTARPYGHPELGSRYQNQHEVTPPRPYVLGSPWAIRP